MILLTFRQHRRLWILELFHIYISCQLNCLSLERNYAFQDPYYRIKLYQLFNFRIFFERRSISVI